MIAAARDPEGARRMSPADVAVAAQLACLLEASAAKPGNVSPGRSFDDLRYEELLASAAAIGAPLAAAGERTVGATVRLAIDATAGWAGSNTNLGIVLLLVPLARAALTAGGGDLRAAVRAVLDATTVDDARDVYAAIRRAGPGGLGTVEQQDVAGEPTASLLDVMRLAASRDAVAREYATAFDVTFLTAVPALHRARRDHLSWDDATVETFLTLLAASPDTHILRRGGAGLAADVSQRARAALDAGGVRSAAGRDAIEAMDRSLRGRHHLANPGTTADLTAAAIFVVLLSGGWHRADADMAARGRT
jgi:triphosphoribosyl-dephospho-CoA synthase